MDGKEEIRGKKVKNEGMKKEMRKLKMRKNEKTGSGGKIGNEGKVKIRKRGNKKKRI